MFWQGANPNVKGGDACNRKGKKIKRSTQDSVNDLVS